MEKSTLNFDITKEFEVDFNIELDSENKKQEEYKRNMSKNILQLRKQVISIDGKIIEI